MRIKIEVEFDADPVIPGFKYREQIITALHRAGATAIKTSEPKEVGK